MWEMITNQGAYVMLAPHQNAVVGEQSTGQNMITRLPGLPRLVAGLPRCCVRVCTAYTSNYNWPARPVRHHYVKAIGWNLGVCDCQLPAHQVVQRDSSPNRRNWQPAAQPLSPLPRMPSVSSSAFRQRSLLRPLEVISGTWWL